MSKIATSFRVEIASLRLLRLLAEKWGVSQADVLALLIRKAAKEEKIK